MKEIQGIIKTNKEVAPSVNQLEIEVDWNEFVPGQFIMLSVPGFFLKRPFGIADLNNGILKLFYKIVGKGTKSLSDLNVGFEVSVLGPLGNGFGEIKPDAIVAGGYGMVPFYGLLKNNAENGVKTKFYYGASHKDALFAVDDIVKWADLKVATDDGSFGIKCFVTDLLKKDNWNGKTIFACGPMPMLKCLATFAEKEDVNLLVSVEARMGCGWGACLGCAVPKSNGGYVHACKDGPVFDYKEIDWERI